MPSSRDSWSSDSENDRFMLLVPAHLSWDCVYSILEPFKRPSRQDVNISAHTMAADVDNCFCYRCCNTHTHTHTHTHIHKHTHTQPHTHTHKHTHRSRVGTEEKRRTCEHLAAWTWRAPNLDIFMTCSVRHSAHLRALGAPLGRSGRQRGGRRRKS